jgi:putative endonuclease
MTKQRQNIGRSGELLARRFLEQKGWKILDVNLRLHTGEIDILAKDKKTIVIVEVKTKMNERFGIAQEEVDMHKQKKLRSLALEISQIYPNSPLRIDVVAINYNNDQPMIEYLCNAVEAL